MSNKRYTEEFTGRVIVGRLDAFIWTNTILSIGRWGSADSIGHREKRSDVAIQRPLILLAFWIASRCSQRQVIGDSVRGSTGSPRTE
jgi:hypothetical protein